MVLNTKLFYAYLLILPHYSIFILLLQIFLIFMALIPLYNLHIAILMKIIFVLFVVGDITSIQCVGMCGGIMLSQSINIDGKNKLHSIKPAILYNVGMVSPKQC